MAEKERLYYVDWLRVLVILSLIPYHAALTYTGIGDIYIKATVHDIGVLPFLMVTTPLDSFFMTFLFFLSGMVTYYSIGIRGKKNYVKERIKKLLLPFFFGTMLLCPLQAYFKGLHDGFTGGFFKFLLEFFSTKIVDYLGYAHLWFLLYLFVFSLICLPLFSNWLNDKTKLVKLSEFLCKGNHIFIPIGFIIVVEMILRPFFPGKQTLIFDWANDIVYLSIFIFGFVFMYDEKIKERVYRLVNPCKIIFPLLAVSYIIGQYISITLGFATSFLIIFWSATKGLFECSAIILFIWLGEKYLNKKSQILIRLSRASFTYYVFHLLPVTMFTYLFLRVQINVYVKYLLIVILSYLFVFAVRALFEKIICKHLGLLCSVFAVFVASIALDIMISATGQPIPWWLDYLKIGVLLGLFLVFFVIKELRSIVKLTMILAVIISTNILSDIIKSADLWKSLFDSTTFLGSFGGSILIKIISTIPIMLILLIMFGSAKDAYLVKGDLSVKASEIKWLGIMDRSISWLKLSVISAILISTVTIVLTIFTVTDKNLSKSVVDLLSYMPWIMLFAFFNSFLEGVIFRNAILACMKNTFPKNQVIVIAGVFFGIAHYYGAPGGVVGVFMSSLLGWYMCRSMYETNGFATSWIIHFTQDIVVFSTIYMFGNYK